MAKIYIDPGHGGSDPGAVGFGVREAAVNLIVAKLLQDELARQGHAVKMSRTEDTLKTLAVRCREANTWGADIVISIHCNAWETEAAHGTGVYIYKKGGNAEKLAKKVQPLLVSALGTRDRSITEGNLAMVRDTKAPAILCELAFITNKADNAKLVSAAYQKKAAVAICKGVCSYLGTSYKEDTMNYKDEKKIPAWAKAAVERVTKKGLMQGDASGKFRPNDPVTRAELAVVLDRLSK